MRDERSNRRARAGLSPAERTLRARLAAHAMHARHDSRQTSAAGRQAFDERFEREVDPDGTLPVAERRRRAEHARREHMTRLALASARARRQRRPRPGRR